MSGAILVIAVVVAVAAGAVAAWLGVALAQSRRLAAEAEQGAKEAAKVASEQAGRDAERLAEADKALEAAKAELGAARTEAREERRRRETVEVPLGQARAETAAAVGQLSAWGEVLLGLQRLARSRNWSILAGPSLPDPWQGSDGDPLGALCAGLGTELEAIREEVGTPGRLERDKGATVPIAEGTAALALVAQVELLRRLAPICEELVVNVAPTAGGGGLLVRIEAVSVGDAAQASRQLQAVEDAMASLDWAISAASSGDSLSVAILVPTQSPSSEVES